MGHRDGSKFDLRIFGVQRQASAYAPNADAIMSTGPQGQYTISDLLHLPCYIKSLVKTDKNRVNNFFFIYPTAIQTDQMTQVDVSSHGI